MKINILVGSLVSMLALTACVPQAPGVPTVPTTPTTPISVPPVTITVPPTQATTPPTTPVIRNGSAQVSCGESVKNKPVITAPYFAINTTKDGNVVLTFTKKPTSHSTFTDRNNGLLFNTIQAANVGEAKVIATTQDTDTWFTLFYNYDHENPFFETGSWNEQINFEIKLIGQQISVKSSLGSRVTASSDYSTQSAITIGHTTYTSAFNPGVPVTFLSVEKYTSTGTLTPTTFLPDPTNVRPAGWGFSGDQIGISSNVQNIVPTANSASIFDAYHGDVKETRFGCQTSASLSY